MFEALILSCLVTAADCRTDRVPAGPTLEDCRATARALAADIAPRRIVQEYPCVPAGADRPAMAMTLIAPGVFVHKGYHAADPDAQNRGDLANIGFVVGQRSVAIIDTGTHPRIGRALLRAVRAETDLPVSHVILTHVHPDHSLGARPIVEAGATLIAHPNYPQAMALRAEGYRANLDRLGLTGLTPSDFLLQAEAVTGTHRIDLGDRVLELTAHRTAHTNNDVTVLDTRTGTLFLGDLLFLDHTPALDGSLAGWIALMDTLARSPARRAVPGHGPVVVQWPTGAAPLRRYLGVLAADTRKAIAEGTPMLRAIGQIAESERENWLFFDQFNPRNASAAFQELEWE